MSLIYSVVIPLKDEATNACDLIEELELSMNSLEKPWELICIDDGSTDETLSILTDLARKKSYMKIISFTQNFGQSSAFDAGFKAAKGKYIITLDGDRQNDPKDIPKLLELIEECDLVCGWRTERKDPWSKKIISKLSNLIRGHLCQDSVHDTGCSLKVYRKSCLQKIKLYHGMHRFLPALFKLEGFCIKEVPVNHRQRQGGKSKYNFFNRSISPFIDLLVVMWMHRRKLHYTMKKHIS